MRAERWQQIEEIVQLALDCAPQNRSALLDSACGEDAELRREIESLLALHGDSGFTTSPAFEDGIKILEQRNGELNKGRRIGAYRVLRQIGRGGMGTVHLAARADDAFQKLVAIKIILRGLDTEDIIQRFRGERQILAMLDHANIARLLDGGTTDDGLPYFVMEYVEGKPLNEYCTKRQLDLKERLALYRSVCEAVQYAHRNLVVHRDLKPGNILIAGNGVPKLLDFGLAKLLEPDTETAKTFTAMRMLTPDYASPEQVRGEPVSTASDVYSLGAILYELLTGARPHQFGTRSADWIERAICREEPEKPSTKNALLRGDLDNIVLKAMAKEPQRRYASVEQLSED